MRFGLLNFVRGYSITTRIKTLSFHSTPNPLIPSEGIPLEQGLKHDMIYKCVILHESGGIPLKQGLRHRSSCVAVGKIQSEGIPLQQGLRHSLIRLLPSNTT